MHLQLNLGFEFPQLRGELHIADTYEFLFTQIAVFFTSPNETQ